MYPLDSDARPICAPLKPNSVIMTTFKSDFLKILTERGFIHQCSDFEGVDALAASGKLVAYVGYDCTAPSLHIGHLLPTLMLHWMQATPA